MSKFTDYKLKQRLTANAFDRNMNLAQITYQKRFNDYKEAQEFKKQHGSYEQALDIAKQYYNSSVDPDNFFNKKLCAKAISQIMPNLSEDYIMNNVEDLMYQATGYRTSEDGWADHIVNTFRASGYNVLASLDVAGLYLSTLGDSDETFEERKNETMERISKYHTGYNRSTFLADNNNLFWDMATEATSIIPSMLPTIAATGVFTLINGLSGGTLLPATTIGAAKAWGTLTAAQKLATAGLATAKFGAAALQEFGGIALDLTDRGVDRDIVLWTSASVGLMNGALEVLGDRTEAMFAKPLNAIFDSLGPKEARNITRKAVADVFKDYAKDLVVDNLKNIASETLTEIPQELVSMLGTNIALEIQKSTGRPIEDSIGYTTEEIISALAEVGKSTIKGTAFLGFTSGAIKTSGKILKGDFTAASSSGKYTRPEGSNAIIKRTDTETVGESSFSNLSDIKKNKIDPIPVVKIGKKFFTYNATPEQNLVASKSKYFNAVIKSIPADITHAVDFMGGEIKRTTLMKKLEDSYRNGNIKGLSYLDNSMKPVDSIFDADYVAIESRSDVPTGIIKLGEKDTVSSEDFDRFMFNEEPEVEETVDESKDEPEKTQEKPKKERKKKKEETKTTENNESDSEKNANTETDTDTDTDTETNTDTDTETDTDNNTESEIGEDELSDDYEADDSLLGLSSDDESKLTSKINNILKSKEEDYNTADNSSSENTSKSNNATEENVESTENSTDKDKENTQADKSNDSKGSESVETKPEPETKPETKPETETKPNKEAEKKAEAEKERKDKFKSSDDNKASWEKAKSSLTTDEKELKDLDEVRDRILDIVKKIPKLSASEDRAMSIANTTAIVAEGFARAQGIPVKQFMDLDIEVVESAGKKLHGSYTPASGDSKAKILLTMGENVTATPSTLAHELAHAFLSTIESEELKAQIRKSFKLGDKANINSKGNQETFARAFEKYLQGFKTSNSFIDNLFNELREICKNIWTIIKKNAEPSEADFFDRLFSDTGFVIDQDVKDSVAKAKEKAKKKEKKTGVNKVNSDIAQTVITKSDKEKMDSNYEIRNPGKSEVDFITNNAKKDNSYLKAPNGNKTNLSEHNWIITRTKAFFDRFGDWIHHPERSSVMLDENGEPKIYYHRTASSFKQVIPQYVSAIRDMESARVSVFNKLLVAANSHIVFKDDEQRNNFSERFMSMFGSLNENTIKYTNLVFKRIAENGDVLNLNEPDDTLDKFIFKMNITPEEATELAKEGKELKDSLIKSMETFKFSAAAAPSQFAYIFKDNPSFKKYSAIFESDSLSEKANTIGSTDVESIYKFIPDQFMNLDFHATDEGYLGKGQYFASQQDFDAPPTIGSYTYEVFLNLRNPLVLVSLNHLNGGAGMDEKGNKYTRPYLYKNSIEPEKGFNYDGVVAKGEASTMDGTDEVCVFNSDNIIIADSYNQALRDESNVDQVVDAIEQKAEVDSIEAEFSDVEIEMLDKPEDVTQAVQYTAKGEDLFKVNRSDKRVKYEDTPEKQLEEMKSDLNINIDDNEVVGAYSKPSQLTEYKDGRLYSILENICDLTKGTITKDNLFVLEDEFGSLYVRTNINIQTNGARNILVENQDYTWVYLPVNNTEAITDYSLSHSLTDTMIATKQQNTVLKNNFIEDEDDGGLVIKGKYYEYDPRIVADTLMQSLSEEGYYASMATEEEILEEKAEKYATMILSNLSDQEILKLKSGYEKYLETSKSRRQEKINNIIEENRAEYEKQNLTEEEMQDEALKQLSLTEDTEDASFEEYLSLRREVRGNLKDMDEASKNATVKYLSKLIESAENSYTSVARNLSDAVKKGTEKAATERANSAIERFIELYKKARKHMLHPSDVDKALGEKYFSNNMILYNKFLNRVKAWTKDKNGKANKKDMIKFLETIIDSKGNIQKLTKEEDGTYRSYLIDLINFANHIEGKKSDNPTSNVDPEFYKLSNDLLRRSDPVVMQSEDISIDEVIETMKTILENKSNQVIFDVVGKAGTVNMLIKSLIEKIGDIKDQISTKTKEKNISVIDYNAKTKKIQSLEKQLESMTKKNESSKSEIDSLKETIKTLKEDPSYKALKNKIHGLNIQISKLQNKIDSMENSNEFIAAAKIREKYLELDRKLRHIGKNKKDDARAAADFRRIYNEIRKFKDDPAKYKTDSRKRQATEKNVIHPSFLKAKYEQNSSSYDVFIDTLFDYGIIEDRDGVIYITKPINNLDVDELASFIDSANDYINDATDDSNYLKQEKAALESRLQNQVRESLYRNKISAEEANKILETFLGTERPGSETENKYRKGGILHTEELELISNIAKRISPEFYAYLFGGQINGKLVERNLNSMTDAEIINKNKRYDELSTQISKIFGIDKKNLKNKTRSIFSSKLTKLKSISIEDYEKNNKRFGVIIRRGNAFHAEINNTNPKWEALSRKVLTLEEKATKGDAEVASAKIKIERLKAELKNITDESKRTEIEGLIKTYEKDISDAFTSSDLRRLVVGKNTNREYDMQELMGIYIFAQNSKSLEDMLPDSTKKHTTNNIPLGTILYVVDKFQNDSNFRKYRLAADAIQEIVGERFADFEDAYYNVTGKVLDKEDNYYTVRRDYEIDDYSLSHSLFGNEDIRAIETKKRSNAKRALDLNVVDNFAGIIEEQEHYIAFAEGMKNYSTLLNRDSDFTRTYLALEENKGNNKAIRTIDALNKWLQLIADPTYGIRKNASDVAKNKLRANFMVSALAGNLSSVLQSLPTYFLTARRVGFTRATTDLVRYMTKSLNGDHSYRDIVYNMSPQMKDRKRYEIARFNEMKNKYVSEFDRAINEKFGKGNDITGDIKNVYNKVMDILLAGIDKADSAVANASWWSIYNYNLSHLDNKSVDKTKMSKEELQKYNSDFKQYCANMATQEVLDMNSSYQAKDNSLLYGTAKIWLKDLLMFTSQPSKQFNMILGSAKRLLSDKSNRDYLKQLVMDTTVVMVVSAAASFISGGFYPDSEDDDEWNDWLMNGLEGTAIELIGSIPILGKGIKEVLEGVAYADVGIPGSIVNLIKVIGKDEEDRTENQLSRAWVKAINSIGEVIGYPAQAINKLYNVYVNDMNFGYLVNTPTGREVERRRDR